MAASTVILGSWSNSTDAYFRLWGKVISDFLATTSWVQSSDTGQINWATVAAPASYTSASGYEIWRSNDAGGGLNQIFVKIEYGSVASPSLASNPGVYITAGFASDGAGNLTGYTSTRKGNPSNNSFTGTPSTFNMSAGPGWMVIHAGLTSGSAGSFMFSVERTTNQLYQDANELLVQAGGTTTGSSYPTQSHGYQVVKPTYAYPMVYSVLAGGITSSIDKQGFIMPGSTENIQFGKVGLGILFPMRGYFGNPSKNVLSAYNGQLGAYQGKLVINNFGQPHTYIINYFDASSRFGDISNATFLTRFE